MNVPRLTSAARLASIREEISDGALKLAYHAAVPVVIDPTLLNLLRVNFFLDPPDAVPHETEAALLRSSLFREIGEELYEIQPDVRNLLLTGLYSRYGPERVRRVALLLEQYTDATLAWHAQPELERAQQLAALSFVDPARASQWLESAGSGSLLQALGREWYVAMHRRMAQQSTVVTASEETARRLASCVSERVEWPDAEVRQVDRIPDSEREHWWTVYITNGGAEPISDVEVTTIAPVNRHVSFRIDEVPQRQRRWYNLHLPQEPGIDLGWPPPTSIGFTVAKRRFRRLADGPLEEQLPDSSFEPVPFGESESRELAEQLTVWIGRPDEKVRRVDGLSANENWWVVYLEISGDRPVHHVRVIVSGESRQWQQDLPPVEPGERRWWILRPHSGFGFDPQMPQVQAEFDALGYRWRRTGDELKLVVSNDELERVVSKSDARKKLETAARQYEMTRDSKPASWYKTREMEEIVANARMYARAAEFTSAQISEQLSSTRPGDRVIALATVEATSNPDTFPGVFAIVRNQETAKTMPFEQYHALHALESLRPALTPDRLTEVIDLLEGEQWRGPLHEGDPGRLELADRILQGAKRQVGAA